MQQGVTMTCRSQRHAVAVGIIVICQGRSVCQRAADRCLTTLRVLRCCCLWEHQLEPWTCRVVQRCTVLQAGCFLFGTVHIMHLQMLSPSTNMAVPLSVCYWPLALRCEYCTGLSCTASQAVPLLFIPAALQQMLVLCCQRVRAMHGFACIQVA